MLLPYICQQKICPSSVIHANYFTHRLSDSYVSIYTSYELNPINNDQKHWYAFILYYWHMPLNRYTSHITHMCQIALLLQCKYRPTLLQTSIKNLQHLFTILLQNICQEIICPMKFHISVPYTKITGHM